MKKVLVLLVFAVLTLPVMAQLLYNPDLDFSINFPALNGSSLNSFDQDDCIFYHSNPFLPSTTNFMVVYLDFSRPPDGAWISERKNNGALIPMLEFTNIITGEVSQLFTLNQNQIRSLARGDWYVSVDFDGTNYLSNLAPQYKFARGPTAAINFRTPIYQQSFSEGTTVFIAKNNQDAKVVINASQSFDPLYLSKTYSWCVFEGDYDDAPAILSTNAEAVATYDFNRGFYNLRLQVDDALTAGGAKFFNVEVITPSQAVESIIQEIQYLQLADNTTQTLVGTLSRASQFFDQGDLARGCGQLELFIRQAKPLHFVGTVDDFTSQSARRIIAVLGYSIPSKIIQFED